VNRQRHTNESHRRVKGLPDHVSVNALKDALFGTSVRTLGGIFDWFGLLPERASQVGVDQLVEPLAHVADERPRGGWFLDMKGPSKVGTAAETRW
jgi:hypothetical protein